MPYEVRTNFEGQELRTFETAREALDWAADINNQGGTVLVKKDGKLIEPDRLREQAANEPEFGSEEGEF